MIRSVASPIADPGFVNSIPARSHTFVKIDQRNSPPVILYMILATHHIWANADTVGLNSGQSLNLHSILCVWEQ